MNKKSALYTLVGLAAGSLTTAIAFSTIPQLSSQAPKTAQAQPTVTPPASPQSNTTPPTWMPGKMMGQPEQHFIVMMIPHHEGAIAMAELAESRATHPEIKQLETIKTTQNQEIEQMQAWYKEWYGTDVPTLGPGMGMGHMSMGHRGMGHGSGGMMGTDLYALENAAEFDRAFIEQMIPHHQMAVMMASMVLSNATRPEIRELAQSIIDSQSAEIEQMQQWYEEWYQP
jgi:uncharacterized protein (DUF305 family)